ncbi:MFS general substrate transporter [Venturia nashicola]|nr:MFS general substrate transporter [Venturia nashicola]
MSNKPENKRFVTWTPPRCRFDAEKPPQFSMALNVLFGFAACFTVANLYYSHPILNLLAKDFGVDEESIVFSAGEAFDARLGWAETIEHGLNSGIPTLAQAGIGLCITKSLAVFSAISFITAVTTVTPQIMLPLVGDLAPPNKRAAALSIVVCGLTLGILIARVLSGVVANYTSWRTVYWIACGLQYLITILLWWFMPDYPSTNPGGLNYFKMLWSIVLMIPKHAVLVQACLISFLTSATFTNFWTTLTFLLAGPPYHYSPLPIGLFGLIGIGGMMFGPVYVRFVTDKFMPWLSVLVGLVMVLVAVTVGTYTGTLSIAGVIIQAILHDAGMTTAQVANRSSIYSLEPKARNRINTVFMLGTFCGQLSGTAVGNHVYARGGWIRSGSVSVGFCAGAILILCLRGPWESGWLGWHGGWSMRKKNQNSSDGKTAEKAMHTQPADRRGEIPAEIEKVDEEMAAVEAKG